MTASLITPLPRPVSTTIADADPRRLNGRTIAIIGYGSQGHAHALNLRDSGARVIVGLREGGESWARAKALGPRGPARSPTRHAAADVIMVLVPDQDGRTIYDAAIAPVADGGQDADVRPRLQYSFQ